MDRTHAAGVMGLIIALIAVMGGLSLWQGGLYLDRYEGDVLHLIEIVMRLAEGQRPHLDFMTPIGVLATWPIAVFVGAGLGIGMAMHAAQVALALVLALPVLRAAHSRFAPGLSHLFAAVCMVMVLALVHGGADAHISMSMHYNRWAWAFCFVALALAVLPPRGRDRPVLDGVLIGTALAAVVLIKVTYVVALLPGIVVALLARRAFATFRAALAAGLVTLGVATVLLGWELWPAYAADLIATATSEHRSHPGQPFDQILTAPLFIGANLVVLACVVMLRKGGRQTEGLTLLVLFPGLVYVTYQNFGNDPQWLMPVALVLLMVRPAAGALSRQGWDLRQGVTLAAVALLALVSPSFVNMAFSPMRHAASDKAEFVAGFPHSAQHGDYFTLSERAFQVNQLIAGERAGAGLEQFAELSGRGDPAVLNGERLPVCGIQNGLIGTYRVMTETLEAKGFVGGKSVLVADLLSNLPLFSDGIPWVQGGAPWRYDGVPGIENADYVLVPFCAVAEPSRNAILKAIDERGIALREVYRDAQFVLLEKA